MKSLITIFLLLFFYQTGFTQTKLCNAVIYWKYEGAVKIYDKPNGKELSSIQNDIKYENYIRLTIKELKDNFFLVEIQLENTDKTYFGWIERSEYIGAFVRQENEYMVITLYADPHTSSKPIELAHWKAGFVTIEECYVTWTKVTVTYEEKRITGWIESIELCANNYTSCN